MKHIDQHNVMAVTKNLPHVRMAPLPAGAQFLNVIESVFSGMARAILHNSDYGSLDEARAAIDRYFQERNLYFQQNPRRAGHKIWVRSANVPCLTRGTIARTPTITGSCITRKSWLGISPNSSFWHTWDVSPRAAILT
jgi:hypothetical protein